ncbi:MAG: LPS export ABC transporter permease LptG [Desulfobacterales bacterium]|jgi:lipopolysaccharide export system permease protein|nr:LPS export ABC transporter permease LptG [Desulfobacteraceae bacterium]MBT4364412.1 LPS export ABC transporter permease LptG [Desulfobacteraceae bacterium]MBT7085693.1 LPS export ABC transporter permease LptG [Desulfobacterales bacterium]MBT7696228.1 LPS export ABC transporter permease LptG [Desulfobacterales bacterium]
MTIIYKYLIKEIFKYFSLILTMVVGVYIAVDFFDEIDEFLAAGLGFSNAFLIFMFDMPIAQLIPVCILLAVLVTFGMMSKNNEILALKSSGVSVYYLLKPVFVIGIVLSVFVFFLSEVLVPVSRSEANKLWLKKGINKSVTVSKEKDIWIKSRRSISHIKYYHPSENAIFGITIIYFDVNFKMIRRIDAKNGLYKEGKWYLHDIVEQKLDSSINRYVQSFPNELVQQFGFSPEDFKKVIKKADEMSFIELNHYIKKVESEGYDATTYKVDLYGKCAVPVVCLIWCILGLGIAVQGEIKGGLSVCFAYGIGAVFLHRVFYSFCLVLGYGQMLPPFFAAWTANFIFLCFGVITLINAE